jgi:hypothetical protein
MQSATPQSFDPGDVLRAILRVAEALFADMPWSRRLLEMEEESSAGAFGFHDSLQNNVMAEVDVALRHLTTSDARCFFGFDRRKRAYLCPVCYQHANHDAQDQWPALAQLAGTIGEPLVADDDENVIVRAVSAVRIVDPAATRMAAVEDDLEDADRALPLGAATFQRALRLPKDDPHDAFEITLDRRRKVVEGGVGSHTSSVRAKSRQASSRGT